MSVKSFLSACCAALSFLTLLSLPVQASVVVNGTRVVYPGSEKEVTVKLSNKGKLPVLVQSWIDTGDVKASPDKIQVPFILTPPINRINPDKSQTLRLSYTASPALPEDRESVYWLNVLEIPPLKKGASPNHLQVAYRTRIKLFYRPAALASQNDASGAAEKVTWRVEGNELVATNASPYFISLASIQAGGHTIAGEMLAPQGSHRFPLKSAHSLSQGTQVIYEYINDWGAVKTVKTAL